MSMYHTSHGMQKVSLLDFEDEPKCVARDAACQCLLRWAYQAPTWLTQA
jgi:hypothetical protein